MDRYIITSWARRTFIIIIGFAAFVWGIRQASLTYQIWQPKEKKEVVVATPAVPDGAKTIGENFLLFWFATGFDSGDQKKSVLIDLLSDRAKNQLDENPNFLLANNKGTKVFRVDRWDEQWIEVDKQAFLRYRVQFNDSRTILVQIPLVKNGTWLVDGLPTLLPNPTAETGGVISPPAVDDQTMQQVDQVVDGFFDSWLPGRQDQNTKLQNVPPSNLLAAIKGSYENVIVTPISTDPLIVSAVVFIKTNGELLPFEYRLQIGKQNGQYFVQKIVGGN